MGNINIKEWHVRAVQQATGCAQEDAYNALVATESDGDVWVEDAVAIIKDAV